MIRILMVDIKRIKVEPPLRTRRQVVVGEFPLASPFKLNRITTVARFDFVTLRKLPANLITPTLLQHLGAIRKEGRLRALRNPSQDWLTIHEPTPKDFNVLLNEAPEAELLGLELAIDFYAFDGRTPSIRSMHKYLMHGLYPTRFKGLEKAKRHEYEGQVAPRYSFTASGNGKTAYWKEPRRYFELKLYQKLTDKREPLFVQPRCRLEIRLNRGGCQKIGITRAAGFLSLMQSLRRIFSRAFSVARGVKFQPSVTKSNFVATIRRVRRRNVERKARLAAAFTSKGAMWCVKKGWELAPDASITRMVGGAMQRLSRSFKSVKIHPKKRKQVKGLLEADRNRYLTRD